MVETLWQQWRQRQRIRAAWGCALGPDLSCLMALGVQAPGHWRVLASLQRSQPLLRPPQGDEEEDQLDAQALRELLQSPQVSAQAGVRQLCISLPLQHCILGHGDWPASMPRQEAAARIHQEAAAALNLAPAGVCLDLAFVEHGQPPGAWHWAACARSDLRQLHRAVKGTQLQLWAVEPLQHAVERACRHLVDGTTALWSTPKDWQFSLQSRSGPPMAVTTDMLSYPQLVACGLALAPLLESHGHGA